MSRSAAVYRRCRLPSRLGLHIFMLRWPVLCTSVHSGREVAQADAWQDDRWRPDRRRVGPSNAERKAGTLRSRPFVSHAIVCGYWVSPASDGPTDGGSEVRPLVEIVPNFSEGRRQDVIDAILAALRVQGVSVLNTQWDPDHNRLDASLVGSPDAVRASALAGTKVAAELIDMEAHQGNHPRMGATDVIPFLPIRDVTMDDCVALARDVAREIGEQLRIPAYCYDRAALSPDRPSLADVRKGEYEGLRADVASGRP